MARVLLLGLCSGTATAPQPGRGVACLAGCASAWLNMVAPSPARHSRLDGHARMHRIEQWLMKWRVWSYFWCHLAQAALELAKTLAEIHTSCVFQDDSLIENKSLLWYVF